MKASRGADESEQDRLQTTRPGHDEDTPNAADEHRTRPDVLSAAALQGAIFAGVEAAVDLGCATATRRLTGTWPG